MRMSIPVTILAEGERVEIGRAVYDDKRERLDVHFNLKLSEGVGRFLAMGLSMDMFDEFAFTPLPRERPVTVHIVDDNGKTLCSGEEWTLPELAGGQKIKPCEKCVHVSINTETPLEN